MPCAVDELCAIPGLTPEPPNGHACRGGCSGRLRGLWGEAEDPDGDNPMHRICHACAIAESSTKDAVTAPAGKRKSTGKEGRGAGPWKTTKSGEGKTDESTSRASYSGPQAGDPAISPWSWARSGWGVLKI